MGSDQGTLFTGYHLTVGSILTIFWGKQSRRMIPFSWFTSNSSIKPNQLSDWVTRWSTIFHGSDQGTLFTDYHLTVGSILTIFWGKQSRRMIPFSWFTSNSSIKPNQLSDWVTRWSTIFHGSDQGTLFTDYHLTVGSILTIFWGKQSRRMIPFSWFTSNSSIKPNQLSDWVTRWSTIFHGSDQGTLFTDYHLTVGSIFTIFWGKQSRRMIPFSWFTSNSSIKPNQYITIPGPNLQHKNNPSLSLCGPETPKQVL